MPSSPISRGASRVPLDLEPWTAMQKWILALGALAVMLDGLDNLLLGFIIPALIKDWGVPRSAFVPIVALSILSMSIGTVFIGALGDRFGRRPMLTVSVLIFGIATLLAAQSAGLTGFTALRIIAALGLGGVFPNATALIAEFTPARRRNLAVSLTILCFPLGGLLGGLLAAQLLPVYGWRMLCVVGGGLPFVVALFIYFGLAESPEIRQSKTSQAVPQRLRGSPALLLNQTFRRDTLALWAMLFFNSLAVYGVFNWAPTLLSAAGYSLERSSLAVSEFNFGGIIGALAGGWMMDRFGSRRLTITYAFSGSILGVLLVVLGWPGSPHSQLALGMTALGICCCGLQPMLFALAAGVYPAEIRGSGVGTAIGIGRLGAIASALVGAGVFAIQLPQFLLIFASALLLTGLALCALRQK